MFDFHQDRRRYFDMQATNAKESLIPFIETHFPLPSGARVLEIGCGEGGVLKSFIERGCTAVGVEIEPGRVKAGMEWMDKERSAGDLVMLVEDIFNVIRQEPSVKYDLIILKDVIEHLPDKEFLFHRLKDFLYPGGAVFVGFPPWHMPFGGHQQMCRNKFLGRFPWLHLLPKVFYNKLLVSFNEPARQLMEVYDTRISIEKFERLARRNGYTTIGKKHFLIAPIYRYKFRLREREQPIVIRNIPYLRNLFTTAVYYLITVENKGSRKKR
jgi:SAM-dependent methyltransferase